MTNQASVNYYDPDSKEPCIFCIALQADDEPIPSDGLADWMVAGYRLCQPHAVAETMEVMESPGSFAHSWPSQAEVESDWRGAVPFHFEIHMIRP